MIFNIFFYNIFMFDSIWYKSLTKPPFAPPDWLFAPVWGFLYLTIALSFLIYITKPAEDKKIGYVYFVIQLVLNLAWSPIFFGLKEIFWAFILIILMDIFVYLTIRKFYSVSKISGLILIPYFIWILFATYLNAGYLFLN